MMEPDPSPSTDLHLNTSGHINNSSWSGFPDSDSLMINQTLTVHIPFHNALLGVFLALLSLLTIIMNLLVLYAVKREKSLHTVGNLYIVSLSVADLIVGTTVMPLNLMYLLEDEWKLGRAVCQFWLIMDYVASTASIFSLFILCLDRYRSIRQPLKYIKYRTRGKASLMICGAWLLSMMWIIPILGWRSFTHVDLKPEEENKCDTDFRFSTWFKVITAVFNFYVPSVLMFWFYTHIYLAVRQHLKDREKIIHPTNFFGDNENSQNVKMLEASAKKRTKQLLLDQNTLDQVYSFEDTNKTKAAQSCSQNKIGVKYQQTSLLFITRKKFKMAQKSKKCSLSPEDQQPDTEIPLSPLSVAQDVIFLERNKEHKLQASLNECPITVPNSVSDISQVSEVQGFTPALCDSYDHGRPLPWTDERTEDTQLDPANAVTLKKTWQKFIVQSRQRIQSLRIQKEHKAAKQLGLIIAAFFLCWIPYFIAFMVMAFCRECVHHDLHMFTIWLGYINSTLNPFIYPLCNGNFKRVFKNIFHIRL